MLLAELFKGRGERSGAGRGAPPLPREVGASLLDGLPLSLHGALKRKEGSFQGSPQRGSVASRRRTTNTPKFWIFNQIPFQRSSFLRKKEIGTRLGPLQERLTRVPSRFTRNLSPLQSTRVSLV